MSLRRSPTRTARFLEANRGNARKSTGPRSQEGKEKSRFNRFRHGMRSSRFGEAIGVRRRDAGPPGLYEAILEELMQVHRTTGLTQEEIEGLARIYWDAEQRLNPKKGHRRRG